MIQPAVMWNLLGDIWPEDGSSPDWTPILKIEGAFLHLYGKHHARRGRKMGHVTFVADSTVQALDNAIKCRAMFGIDAPLNS